MALLWVGALAAFGHGCRGSVDLRSEDICPLSACGGNCAELACRDAQDCPRGTACEREICRVRGAAEVGADLLIDGFSVAEFELTQVPATAEAERVFEWFAPDGTKRATCALFVCAPAFSRAEGPSGTTLGRISNAARCIDRQRIFRVDEAASEERLSFTLGALEPLTSTCSSGLGLRPSGQGGEGGAAQASDGSGDGSLLAAAYDYPVVETLRLGCWAMDTSRVIGATRLVPVSPSDLPDTGTLRFDCTSAPSGSFCQLPRDSGVCCEQRCRYLRSSCADAAGAGGEGGELAELPEGVGRVIDTTDSVVSCQGEADGVRCRREVPTGFGQCALGGCVEQGDVAGYRPPLVINQCDLAGFATDWLNCFPSPILDYGTCHDRACRTRCQDDGDCEEAQRRTNASRTSEVLSCRRPPGSYLGVCED